MILELNLQRTPGAAAGRPRQRVAAGGEAGRGSGRSIAALVLLVLVSTRCLTAVTAAGHASGTEATAAGAQFALIVNGDDSFTHNYNVQMAVDALPRLGYSPAHILLVAAGGHHGEDPGIRRLPATADGLAQAMALLQRELGPRDVLLVYLTGHGGRAFGRAFLKLESGTVTAAAFVHRLSPLPFARLILIADQCYSGGFLEEAVRLGRDVVGVASADSHHEVRCEPFIRPLWLAAASAPSAAGGAVSVEEAYRAGADSLARGLAHEEVDVRAQYVATGRCQGHPNLFGFGQPSQPGTDQSAGTR